MNRQPHYLPPLCSFKTEFFVVVCHALIMIYLGFGRECYDHAMRKRTSKSSKVGHIIISWSKKGWNTVDIAISPNQLTHHINTCIYIYTLVYVMPCMPDRTYVVSQKLEKISIFHFLRRNNWLWEDDTF